MLDERPSRAALLAVLVAALGYFVDIYDLILFSIVRTESLTSLGVDRANLADTVGLLLNMQMGGMLVGGLFWGILGDKRGRLSVLFGSIALYSVANIANGFVDHAPADHAIEANLRALREGCTGRVAVVGSVTRNDDVAQRMIRGSTAALVPRGLATFRSLVQRAGFDVTRSIARPFADDVCLEAMN